MIDSEDAENTDIIVGHGGQAQEKYSFTEVSENLLSPSSSIEDIEECMNEARSTYNMWRKDVTENLKNHEKFFMD